MTTVFEKIISGEVDTEKVFENEKLLAIEDISPQAPVHLLIMPKKNYRNIQELPKEDLSIMGEIILVAQQLAEKYGVEDNYRLLTNNGSDAGQTIFHLHFHLIGGRHLGPMA